MVGVGRIGVFHARHIQELARETGHCELVAIVDGHGDTAARVAAELQAGQASEIRALRDVEEVAAADLIDGAMIASRTADHYRDARTLVAAGKRVLLEKPLTHSVESSEEFVAWLNADAARRQAVMLAFMRRFDAPLVCAKAWLDAGRIGRPFKFVSVLEDPVPPPDGYDSPGLLVDMAVHNIDEMIWFGGALPTRAVALGANLYNHAVSSVVEDFDDAFLQLSFPDNVLGQVQVSRNHVAGYRNETWVFGDAGCLHVGHFQENPLSVTVEAYSPAGTIEKRTFSLRDYGPSVPVFIKRFGEAYKAELADFVSRCRAGEPFRVTHEDGLRAMKVAVAGSRALRTERDALAIE